LYLRYRLNAAAGGDHALKYKKSMAHMILVALALVAACAVSAAAPARSESVLVGTLKQCHSVFDCKTTDLQLVRVTGEGVVKKLGIIYRGIPDAQRLSTTVVAAGSAASGIYMVLVTSPVDLNTTAVVLRVAADAQSFSVAASKAVPYINATSISFDESASFACAHPDHTTNPSNILLLHPPFFK
jgi:hypothetical protein